MKIEAKIQEILKTMKLGFKRMDRKLNKFDQRFDQVDSRLDRLESKLSTVIVEVTSNGRKLDQLVTREEFDQFKDQTLTHFDGLSKQIEDLQEDRTLMAA